MKSPDISPCLIYFESFTSPLLDMKVPYGNNNNLWGYKCVPLTHYFLAISSHLPFRATKGTYFFGKKFE